VAAPAPPRPPDPTCVQCDLPVPPARRRAAGSGPAFCCFGCRLAFEVARPAAGGAAAAGGAPTGPASTLLLRLGAGIFLSMNIMVFSGPFYARAWFGAVAAFPAEFGALEHLFAYLLLFLTTIVLALLGAPLLADAVGFGRVRVDTNMLIGAGVVSAYAVSVAHTLRGHGSLYYDTAAMILVLVTLGNYLEAGARRRAAASAGALLAAVPAVAGVRRRGAGGAGGAARGDRVDEVDAASLVPGDEVRARTGEAFAVDGEVAEGESHVDEAILTGESRPRRIGPGDRVLAGTVNLDALVWVRAREVGVDRVIRRMERMLDEARRLQPPIQRLADRIAAWFVPGVIALALGVFARSAWHGDAAGGLFDGLSVLLISCPCALGLAAPLATWSALRRAAEQGILIDSAVTLERAARIGRVFFDKTGTLTEPRPVLTRIAVAAMPGRAPSEDEALRLAAAADSGSLHPVARALADAAAARGLTPPVPESVRVLPGLGVEATVGGRRVHLGSPRLAARLGLTPGEAALAAVAGGAAEDADEATIVHLMDETAILATFHFAENPRADAGAAIAALRRLGAEVEVLTGDRSGPARRLGHSLDVQVTAGLLPEDKLARLEAARSETARRPGRAAGATVAMVGDGLNDAPVLAAADVGFAMGSASDLARQAGHVHLIHDRLDRVPITIALARDAMRRVRLNLAWAFGYNGIGLTLAAMGLLTPIFAASTMIVSSLVIIGVSKGAGRVDARRLGLDPTAPAPGGR
jgi:Cu2+-exporting ATPase